MGCPLHASSPGHLLMRLDPRIWKDLKRYKTMSRFHGWCVAKGQSLQNRMKMPYV